MEKRRRLVAVLDTSACEVARRAEGAGGAPESTWEIVSHEGTKTRRREVGRGKLEDGKTAKACSRFGHERMRGGPQGRRRGRRA